MYLGTPYLIQNIHYFYAFSWNISMYNTTHIPGHPNNTTHPELAAGNWASNLESLVQCFHISILNMYISFR